MSVAPRALAHTASKTMLVLMILVGAQLSMFIGMILSHPSRQGIINLAALAFVGIMVVVARRPFVGWVIFSFTMVFLICFAVNPDRYLNPVDLLLPVIGPMVVLGATRRETLAQDALRTGLDHEALRQTTRRFAKAGIYYLALCTASLGLIWATIGGLEALEILYGIARCIEGALLFPLGLWLIRKDRDIELSVRAMYVAGLLCAIINVIQLSAVQTYRAGMTWVINEPSWQTEDANEAGSTMVILWALILIDHHIKPRFRTFPMLGLVLLYLFLTQSRSGLLALIVFTALSARRIIRWQYLVGFAVLVPLALKLVPAEFIARIVRSVTFERGSFEVYTIIIRFYGYQAAWHVFLDHWLYGVGYMSLRYVSQTYNDLGILMLGAENFFLETAAGLGVIGLSILGFWYFRLFQLGNLCKRLAPPGTRAHGLANATIPLMAALSVANLTCDTFMGLIGTGQVMLWCAILIRSTHFSLPDQSNALATAPVADPRHAKLEAPLGVSGPAPAPS
jgi:hypothetical protein